MTPTDAPAAGRRDGRTKRAEAGAASVAADRLSPIRAVERVCDIFDLLQEAQAGLSLTEIADKTGLPKSTAYRYLIALESRRYIERDEETNIVRLGLAFRPKPSRRMYQFLKLAEGILESVRDRTNETINLGMMDGGQYVHLLVVESPQIMRLAARAGERGMVHSTAIGKVIAAQLSDDRVRAMLESEGMPRLTDRTLTSVDEFLDSLSAVRKQGYGLDDCENQEDGRCLAVPVKGLDVPTALSLSAPARRFPMSKVPEFASLLRAAAGRLSTRYRGLPD